jgi:hypothetical protein
MKKMQLLTLGYEHQLQEPILGAGSGKQGPPSLKTGTLASNR